MPCCLWISLSETYNLRHSGLDYACPILDTGESRLSLWIPAFAGMKNPLHLVKKMGATISIPRKERSKIKKFLKPLLEKEDGIFFAYLHGSFAEGRPSRDIDVAVFVDEREIPKERALDFEISTSMKLGKGVKLPIDLKIINYAPLGFQYYSTAGPLLMCKEDDLRVDFLTRIRSLYFDFKPSSERFLLEMIYAE